MSCILPRVPAISLRTGHLPARDRVRRRPVRSALGLARIQPVAARGVATALPAVQDHVHEWNREDASQLPDVEELVGSQQLPGFLKRLKRAPQDCAGVPLRLAVHPHSGRLVGASAATLLSPAGRRRHVRHAAAGAVPAARPVGLVPPAGRADAGAAAVLDHADRQLQLVCTLYASPLIVLQFTPNSPLIHLNLSGSISTSSCCAFRAGQTTRSPFPIPTERWASW